MTQNQINFFKASEEQRHNYEIERQGRQDVASRRITANASRSQADTAAELAAETKRANLERERVNWFTAQEAARNNKVLEGLSQYKAEMESRDRRYATDTSARFQQLHASIEERQLGINKHEADTHRISALAQQLSANAAALNAQTNVQAQLEQQRANLARERETNRSNLARETNERLYQSYTRQAQRENLQQRYDQMSINERQRDKELDIAAKNAATKRGEAWAEGFKDVTLGVSNIADTATDIYNLVKGVQKDAKQSKLKRAWLDAT